MLNMQPDLAINHTPLDKWCIRPAVSFWANAYVNGVRITWDGNEFTFTEAINWHVRLERYTAFGKFPESKPVEPPAWVVDGISEHRVGLVEFLSQPFPKAYQRFAAHILVLEYEVKPIEANARLNGHLITGTGVNGGYVLFYHGKCKPQEKAAAAPTMPAILSRYGGIAV